MKKIFSYLILSAVVFLNMGVGCSDKSEDPKPDNYTSLLGYWILKGGNTFAKKDDGITIVTANIKPDVAAMELRDDGTMTTFDHTGTTGPTKGTWKLEVTRLNGTDIQEGHLSFYTDDSRKNAGKEFYDADGSMKFSIMATTVSDKLSYMTLTSTKVESYPYKQNWAVHIWEKR